MRRSLADSRGSAAQSKAQSAAQLRDAIDRFPKRQRVQATFFDPTKQSHPEEAATETVSLHLLGRNKSPFRLPSIPACSIELLETLPKLERAPSADKYIFHTIASSSDLASVIWRYH